MLADSLFGRCMTLLIVLVVSGCGATVISSPVSASARSPYVHLRRTDVLRTSSLGQNLIYISAPTQGNVYVYSYPQGKLEQVLTGLSTPTGECSDEAGRVFIIAAATTGTEQHSDILEYAHGGSAPIATLNDPGVGYGCAVDPASGNLAVTNVEDQSNPYYYNYGDVAIYSGAQGSPTMDYTGSYLTFFFCGYDNVGNLYAAATHVSSGQLQLVRLSNGSKAFVDIRLPVKLQAGDRFYPSVQWDGKHITISSDLGSSGVHQAVSVYRLNITGTNAKVLGTTELESKKNLHAGQSWISGKTIAGIDYRSGQPSFSIWPYPNGGNPLRSDKVKDADGKKVWGVTISTNPSH